jgi:hypothetical protein
MPTANHQVPTLEPTIEFRRIILRARCLDVTYAGVTALIHKLCASWFDGTYSFDDVTLQDFTTCVQLRDHRGDVTERDTLGAVLCKCIDPRAERVQRCHGPATKSQLVYYQGLGEDTRPGYHLAPLCGRRHVFAVLTQSDLHLRGYTFNYACQVSNPGRVVGLATAVRDLC